MRRLLLPAVLLLLPVFTLAVQDSVGLKIFTSNKVFIVHRVDKGQTLYSICKRYKVEQENMLSFNPDVKTNGLKVDQYIFIPTSLSVKEAQKRISDAEARKKAIKDGTLKPKNINDNVVYYTVKAGETLFSISRLPQCKFTIDELKRWNKLGNNGIKEGQRLIIDFREEIPIGEEQTPKDSVNRIVEGDDPDSTDLDSTALVTWSDKSEEGLATWIPDGADNSGKSYALYNNAAVGTVIRVVNLANEKVTYVKVIGKISGGQKEDVILVLTEKAAKNLGVEDNFFRVKLVYSTDEL